MWYAIIGIVCLVVGFAAGYFFKQKRITIGTLHMDFRDPYKDVFSIDLNQPPEYIAGLKEGKLIIEAQPNSR